MKVLIITSYQEGMKGGIFSVIMMTAFLFLIFRKMADRFSIEDFAYVLMNNHYHLLLKTNKPNISKSMQWFGDPNIATCNTQAA